MLAASETFFAGHTVAMIGVSVAPTDYSRLMLRTLCARGHDIVPVRPGIDIIEGRQVYSTIHEVPGEIDGAVILTPPHHAERAVFDCIQRGITRFWIDPGAQRGVSQAAVELCRAHRSQVVVGGDPLGSAGLMRRIRRVSGRAFSRAGLPPG